MILTYAIFTHLTFGKCINKNYLFLLVYIIVQCVLNQSTIHYNICQWGRNRLIKNCSQLKNETQSVHRRRRQLI